MAGLRKSHTHTHTRAHTQTHTCTMEYFSDHNKWWNIAIFTNTGKPREYHTKWSKSDRERQIWYHLYVEPNQ